MVEFLEAAVFGLLLGSSLALLAPDSSGHCRASFHIFYFFESLRLVWLIWNKIHLLDVVLTGQRFPPCRPKVFRVDLSLDRRIKLQHVVLLLGMHHYLIC